MLLVHHGVHAKGHGGVEHVRHGRGHVHVHVAWGRHSGLSDSCYDYWGFGTHVPHAHEHVVMYLFNKVDF